MVNFIFVIRIKSLTETFQTRKMNNFLFHVMCTLRRQIFKILKLKPFYGFTFTIILNDTSAEGYRSYWGISKFFDLKLPLLKKIGNKSRNVF